MRFSRRALLTGTTAGLLAKVSVAARGPDGFEVTTPELTVPGLDRAHDGLRIAQLSDIHVGMNTPNERVRAAVRAVNAIAPDLVILTGDFVTYSEKPLPLVAELLAGLSAPTWAVLGNHDHFVDPKQVQSSLESCGYGLLRNQHTVLRLRGVPFTVFGIDDGGTGHDDVARTLRGSTTSGSRIVLTHNPVTVRKLPADEGLVCFSGHTHGGQIVIPPLTDAVASALGQPYIRGHYDVGGNQLYVNRGLGWGRKQDFLHHGSEPEVAAFTLRCVESWPDIGR